MENKKYCLRPNFWPNPARHGKDNYIGNGIGSYYPTHLIEGGAEVSHYLGSDTLTIVVSINSSNAASITVKVIIHFLAPVSTMG